MGAFERTRNITAGVLLGLWIGLAGGEARADCTPDPATEGDTVTCTGTDTDGFLSAREIDDGIEFDDIPLTINVDPAATVLERFLDQTLGPIDPFSAFSIFVGSDSTVTNRGTVTTVGDDTRRLTNAVWVGADSIVENYGTITASNSVAGPWRTIGVMAGARGSVLNAGTVETHGTYVFGISVGDGGLVINDGTVIVSGTDATGIAQGGEIVNNGSVTATAVGNNSLAIGIGRFARDLSITNEGEITAIATGFGQSAFGISTRGDSIIENNGTITVVASNQARGINGQIRDNIVNNGTINVTSNDPDFSDFTTGISTGSSSTITNNGDITANGLGWARGITAGADSVVLNTGTLEVSGGDEVYGISTGRQSEITNNGNITVSSQGVGRGIISNQGSDIFNTGTVDVSGVDESIGILILDIPPVATSGRITTVINNSGTLSAETAIEGRVGANPDPEFSGNELLDNSGTINGDILLGWSWDQVFNRTGGVINGVIDLGGGGDVLINEAGGEINSDGVAVMGSDVFITNDGTINGDVLVGDFRAILTNKSNGVINGAVEFGLGTWIDPSSLVNEAGGLISSIEDAVVVQDQNSIVNNGMIDSSTFGVGIRLANNNEVLNAGTINAVNPVGIGIYAGDDNTSDFDDDGNSGIVNTGTINARAAGIQVGHRNLIVNSGIIDGVVNGITVDNDNILKNTGSVHGGEQSGVLVGAGNDLLNEGTITSDAVGIIAFSENKDDLDGDGNAGIVNAGLIDSGGDGITAWFDNVIENRGTIRATNDGIKVFDQNIPGFVPTNSFINSGLIEAGGTAIVTLGGNHSIENTGTLSGTRAIAGGVGIETVVNTGTVTGDILLSDGADSLTNRSTGVINGIIDLGDGANTLTNEAGGLISSETDAILGQNGNSIVNHGTINSPTFGMGIRLEHDNEVLNTGTINAVNPVGIGIYAEDDNIRDIDGDGNAGIVNTGTINARGAGIFAGQRSLVVNTGVIEGVTNGIIAANNNIVKNTGSVHGGEQSGMLIGSGNDLLNEGTITSDTVGIIVYGENKNDLDGDGQVGIVNAGLIDSGGDGITVWFDNVVENRGTIRARNDGIKVFDLNIPGFVPTNSFVNSGSIEAGGSAIVTVGGDHSIDNSGSIVGAQAVMGGPGIETITNSGTMVGDILLGGGDDAVSFTAGFDVTGDMDGGAGADILTVTGDGSFTGQITAFEKLSLTAGSPEFTITGASDVGVMDLESGRLTLIGTLTVDGDYTQTADGVLSVEIGAGSADLLAVSGTASLDGVIETSFVLGDLAALEGESITVLTAGDVDGQFTNEGTTQQAFWEVTVTSGPTNVQVSIGNIDIPLGATSPGVGALGGALSAFLGGSELASAQIEALSSSSVQSQQITGQASANLATATIGNVASFNDAILNRLQDARFSEAAPAVRARSVTSARSSAPSWVGWVGYSFVSQFDREALERGARNNVLKFSGGADLALSPRARVGYALGLHSSDLDASRFAGDNQIDGVQASLYGAYRQGKAFVNGVFGVANNRFELERDIDFGFVKESLSGEADGTDVNAVVEAGYDVSFRGIRVVPFASLQAVSSHRESYTESGGVFALEVAGDTAYSLQSALGIKLGSAWTTDSGLKISSRLKLAWAHEYLDRRRDVAVAFARLPDRDFYLIGRGINHDALEIENEFGLRLSGQLNAVVKYRGLIGSRDTAHGVTLGFNLAL